MMFPENVRKLLLSKGSQWHDLKRLAIFDCGISILPSLMQESLIASLENDETNKGDPYLYIDRLILYESK